MKSIILGSVAAALALTTSLAAGQCARVEVGKPVQLADSPNPLPVPATATRLVAHLPSAGGLGIEAAAMLVTGGSTSVTVDAAFVQKAQSLVGSPQRGQYLLSFVDAANVAQGSRPFFLSPAESDGANRAAACGVSPDPSPPSALPERPRPATAAECAAVASRSGMVGASYESWLIFDSTGAVCFAPYPLRQRDKLNFAMIWRRGETWRPGAVASVANCKTPTPQPVILSSGEVPATLRTQNARVVTEDFLVLPLGLPVECASDTPKITLAIPQESGTDRTREQTLTLFGRYTAVFHIGALATKLRDTDYGLRTLGGQTTIVNRESEARGPEYVAMVVVQALPKALGRGSYPGRDLLHDNAPSDRLGLALSFGIRDPRHRFGLGLSYELARGINVAGVYEWVRRNQLNGVAVGDAFAGGAGDIPQRREWDKGWSFGLTFDIDYITKIFGAAGK